MTITNGGRGEKVLVAAVEEAAALPFDCLFDDRDVALPKHCRLISCHCASLAFTLPNARSSYNFPCTSFSRDVDLLAQYSVTCASLFSLLSPGWLSGSA